MNTYLADLGIANFEFVDIDSVNQVQEDNAKQSNSKIATQFLVVEKSDIQNSFTTGSEQELLNKMLGAIGVNTTNFVCTTENEIEKYNAEITIFAGNFTNQEFIIPHPAEILHTPELKRDAWEVLKKIKELV